MGSSSFLEGLPLGLLPPERHVPQVVRDARVLLQASCLFSIFEVWRQRYERHLMRSPYTSPILKCPLVTGSWSEQLTMLPSSTLHDIVPTIVALLDGRHTLEEVSGEMLVRGISLDDTFAALNWLDQRGLISETEDERVKALSD